MQPGSFASVEKNWSAWRKTMILLRSATRMTRKKDNLAGTTSGHSWMKYKDEYEDKYEDEYEDDEK